MKLLFIVGSSLVDVLVIGSSDISATLWSSSGVAWDLCKIQFWHVVLAWLVSGLTQPEFDNISDGFGSFIELLCIGRI